MQHAAPAKLLLSYQKINFMKFSSHFLVNICQRWLRTGLLITLLAIGSVTLSAALPAGNAITDGRALLRYALPIDNKPVRDIQSNLEDITNQLRGKRWSPVASDVSKASSILRDRADKILESIPDDRKPQAQAIIDGLNTDIVKLREAVEAKDKDSILSDRSQLLGKVGELQELMVKEFPFTVPAKYSYLPQLKGRATVDFKTSKGDITVIVDGYSAPVTAGNFVDLVQRGFYNGLEFTRSEESYVLQVGDPPGPEAGFIDPKTKKYRNVPLEVLVEGDKEPMYGITLEDAGRYTEQPVLPFSAYGTLAMARPEGEPDGGSSQFFFFLFEPELTPAGRNLLDGRYSVFGYLVEGQEVLQQLRQGDKIESAKVVSGAENLVAPKAA
jgi:peptidylprolyl isomerase